MGMRTYARGRAYDPSRYPVTPYRDPNGAADETAVEEALVEKGVIDPEKAQSEAAALAETVETTEAAESAEAAETAPETETASEETSETSEPEEAKTADDLFAEIREETEEKEDE